jgi:flagellar hook-associated protein 3 FlgL
VRRARELALQGANAGAMGPQAREALATEVDQIREGLLGDANATYVGRPIFGGITSGAGAYDATGAFLGTPGAVERTVAVGITLRVDVDGQAAFGVGPDSVFTHLKDLSLALRAGDTAGISQAIDLIGKDGDRITNMQADAGTRAARIERSKAAAEDAELALSSSLSEVENTDLPKATMELKMQEVAYQAALAATARVTQPSLLDFLR